MIMNCELGSRDHGIFQNLYGRTEGKISCPPVKIQMHAGLLNSLQQSELELTKLWSPEPGHLFGQIWPFEKTVQLTTGCIAPVIRVWNHLSNKYMIPCVRARVCVYRDSNDAVIKAFCIKYCRVLNKVIQDTKNQYHKTS